jgi:hypothetical protein
MQLGKVLWQLQHLTCRARCRSPELRCRSQATALLSLVVTDNTGHMLACAVILCHLRHTRGTGPALRKGGEQKSMLHTSRQMLTYRQILGMVFRSSGNVLTGAWTCTCPLAGAAGKLRRARRRPSQLRSVYEAPPCVRCCSCALKVGRTVGRIARSTSNQPLPM